MRHSNSSIYKNHGKFMEISFLEKTQRSGTSIKTAEGSLDNKNTSHSFIQDTLKY